MGLDVLVDGYDKPRSMINTNAVLWISSSSAELFLSEKEIIHEAGSGEESGIKVWVI